MMQGDTTDRITVWADIPWEATVLRVTRKPNDARRWWQIWMRR